MNSSALNQDLIDTSHLPKSEDPVSNERKEIIGEILELYQCRPTPKLYRHFCPDAHFEDPICDARNLTEIKAQFNGMPSIFPVSQTKQCQVIFNRQNEVHIDLWQEYTFAGFRNVKLMKSLVVVQFDDQGRVSQLEDRWNYKDSWRERHFWSPLTNALRRANARLLPKFVNTD
ncbi:hypothetical protein DSO57_1021682 [Entomophthora muscae]|uniref:Uncharacterized protein n=1 Tax=Entomophthora muscae TaxID=34485 RepID=A0ACC2U1E1_9FUNG|nr:hypothetical protein DSO57_1021682 [Entomophthora muscae]